MFIGHHDPYDYFDTVIGGGIKVSTPMLRKIDTDSMELKDKTFQFDHKILEFMKAKETVRAERLSKYYQQSKPVPTEVLWHFIFRLQYEYPQMFLLQTHGKHWFLFCGSTGDTLVFDADAELKAQYPERGYVNSFDALCMQIQEDVVVQFYDPATNQDFAGAIHLFHPNGWNAEWAIGQGFGYIHENVTDSKDKLVVPPNMVKGLVRKSGVYERVGAISFRTDAILNRHPEEYDKAPYPKFDAVVHPHLYMRFERQTVTTFPNHNCFLFTIKTYFLDVNEKNPERRTQIIQAFENASPDVYAREFMAEKKDEVLTWLRNPATT